MVAKRNIKKDTRPWLKEIPKDDFIGQRIYWLDLGKMMFNFKLILSFYVIALFFYYLWWDLTYWILCLLCAFWQMSPQLRIRTLDALNFTFQLICSLTRNCIISTLSTYSCLPQQSKDIQGVFFNSSSQFSVPKWKTMGSQSEFLFPEIFDVQKILVGWTTFFFLALKFGRNS